MHPYVHWSMIHRGQDMETTKVPFGRWLDKEDAVHTYYGILLSHKKRRNAAISNAMEGSWEYYAEQKKSDRKSQEPYDFTHMWDMKLKATNAQIRKTNKPL